MYDLHDYARMIVDEARTGPYVAALQEVVRPGSVVVDLGAGTGLFSLVACRLGAARVYAIDTHDAVEIVRELARENGFGDRVVVLRRDAREVDLPERADVIVSDLRGLLPLHGDHLAVLADARDRFLHHGGVVLPGRDRLVVAVVERADLHERALGPARGPLGVTLASLRDHLRHAPLADRGVTGLQPRDLLSAPGAWATVDYMTIRPGPPIAGRADLRIERAGTGHGLAVWFEAMLTEAHGFSSGPGDGNCYGRLFLPWPEHVPLARGDLVAADLWASAEGDLWGWNSTWIGSHEGRRFKQSSFASSVLRPVPRGDRRPLVAGAGELR